MPFLSSFKLQTLFRFSAVLKQKGREEKGQEGEGEGGKKGEREREREREISRVGPLPFVSFLSPVFRCLADFFEV